MLLNRKINFYLASGGGLKYKWVFETSFMYQHVCLVKIKKEV